MSNSTMQSVELLTYWHDIELPFLFWKDLPSVLAITKHAPCGFDVMSAVCLGKDVEFVDY